MKVHLSTIHCYLAVNLLSKALAEKITALHVILGFFFFFFIYVGMLTALFKFDHCKPLTFCSHSQFSMVVCNHYPVARATGKSFTPWKRKLIPPRPPAVTKTSITHQQISPLPPFFTKHANGVQKSSRVLKLLNRIFLKLHVYDWVVP